MKVPKSRIIFLAVGNAPSGLELTNVVNVLNWRNVVNIAMINIAKDDAAMSNVGKINVVTMKVKDIALIWRPQTKMTIHARK